MPMMTGTTMRATRDVAWPVTGAPLVCSVSITALPGSTIVRFSSAEVSRQNSL